jgi:hypothetical protein
MFYFISLLAQESAVLQVHCDSEKSKRTLKFLAKNMQSTKWSFKSWVFCRVQLELSSGCKGLVNHLQGYICISQMGHPVTD